MERWNEKSSCSYDICKVYFTFQNVKRTLHCGKSNVAGRVTVETGDMTAAEPGTVNRIGECVPTAQVRQMGGGGLHFAAQWIATING